MGTPQSPNATPGKFQIGSVTVPSLPEERTFPLREDQIEVLCEGENHEAKAARDLYLGLAMSAIIGLIGLAATTDWDAVFSQRRKGPLTWMAILLTLVVAPGLAAIVHHRRYARTRDDSPYSRLKKRISEHFKGQAP